MPELPPEEAIERARTNIGLDRSVPARAFHTRRLDKPGQAYYLVIFGESAGAVALGAVDAGSGAIQVTARLPGASAHLSIDGDQARRLAGLPEPAGAELVWRPCRASRSCLYPLWEIRSGSQTIYVDQQGGAWSDLDPPGPHG